MMPHRSPGEKSTIPASRKRDQDFWMVAGPAVSDPRVVWRPIKEMLVSMMQPLAQLLETEDAGDKCWEKLQSYKPNAPEFEIESAFQKAKTLGFATDDPNAWNRCANEDACVFSSEGGGCGYGVGSFPNDWYTNTKIDHDPSACYLRAGLCMGCLADYYLSVDEGGIQNSAAGKRKRDAGVDTSVFPWLPLCLKKCCLQTRRAVCFQHYKGPSQKAAARLIDTIYRVENEMFVDWTPVQAQLARDVRKYFFRAYMAAPVNLVAMSLVELCSMEMIEPSSWNKAMETGRLQQVIGSLFSSCVMPGAEKDAIANALGTLFSGGGPNTSQPAARFLLRIILGEDFVSPMVEGYDYFRTQNPLAVLAANTVFLVSACSAAGIALQVDKNRPVVRSTILDAAQMGFGNPPAPDWKVQAFQKPICAFPDVMPGSPWLLETPWNRIRSFPIYILRLANKCANQTKCFPLPAITSIEDGKAYCKCAKGMCGMIAKNESRKNSQIPAKRVASMRSGAENPPAAKRGRPRKCDKGLTTTPADVPSAQANVPNASAQADVPSQNAAHPGMLGLPLFPGVSNAPGCMNALTWDGSPAAAPVPLFGDVMLHANRSMAVGLEPPAEASSPKSGKDANDAPEHVNEGGIDLSLILGDDPANASEDALGNSDGSVWAEHGQGDGFPVTPSVHGFW